MTAERTDRNKNIMKRRRETETREFDERVIEVNRISRTVKGGRRIRFRALVVAGNHQGKVGAGVAKANDVTEAVKKAATAASKHIMEVPVIDGTIPYEVESKYGSAKVILKPAASGTSIVAGGSVRVVCELAGITDILSKIMGSQNKVNNVMATLKALTSFNEEYVKKIQKYSKSAQESAKPEIQSVEEKLDKAETAEKPSKVIKDKPKITKSEK